MTRMGSSSQLGDLKGFTKSIRSSKKSLLYGDCEVDLNRRHSSFSAQRSVSLTTLNPPPIEPRMAQLENLEAKMASIEVSLSTSSAPRRKKSAPSTPVPGTPLPAPPSRSATPKDLFNRDTSNDTHKTSPLIDKENNLLHNLKNQLAVSRLSYGNKTCSTLNESEKKAAHERLSKLKSEVENKRIAIKNIKLALQTIDVTDNIDSRIQQAELEYQLGREELNLLSIMEESRNLHVSLEGSNTLQPTIFTYIGISPISLYAIELVYDAKSPQFGVCQKDDGGLYVDWSTEESGLNKGDRLLEVNGKLVLSKNKEDMKRLLSVSPNPAQLVVMRRHNSAEQLMSHLEAELSVVREQAGEAERLRDSFRSDNVRLSHRISYLEEQVAELLQRAHRKETRKKDVQVFQKGAQVTLVTDSTKTKAKNKDDIHGSRCLDFLVEKPKRKKDIARSTNSLDVEAYQHKFEKEKTDKYKRDVRSSLGYIDFDSESNYKSRQPKHLDYSSESSVRQSKKFEGSRPIPPKKPVRLSLQKACSMQSVDSNSTLEKRTLKRTHKGEAPPVPKSHSHIQMHLNSTDSWC